jgi:hypothetical protein
MFVSQLTCSGAQAVNTSHFAAILFEFLQRLPHFRETIVAGRRHH